MSKANKIKENFTIDQQLDILKNKIQEIDPNSTPDLINDIRDRFNSLSELTKRTDRALNFLFYVAAIFVVLTIGLGIEKYQATQYQHEIEVRLNNQLSESVKQDSLFNKYLAVDSTGKYTTFSEGGQILSYKDLYQKQDSLREQNIKIKDSLDTVKQRLNMAKTTYGIYFTEKNVGTSTYITIGSKKFEEMDRNGVESMKKIQPLLDSINKKVK